MLVGSLFAARAGSSQTRSRPATRDSRPSNVILVTIDGSRWQDVYRGGDCTLMNKEDGGVEDTLATRARWCRSTPDSARRVLMPFFWEVMATRGAVFGDRDAGGDAHISNTMKFSYPGYNEILTGRFDPRIDKNGYGLNPNVTVFEWLAGQAGFRGKVEAWGTWDVFDNIFNEPRARFPVRSGWEPPFPRPRDAVERELDALWATTTRHWDYMPFDAFLQRAVLHALAVDHPRVTFVGFGEPDEWAHDRRYDHYLESLHGADGYLAELWETLQRDPAYRGHTTLIVLCDHGRGRTPRDWTDHGRDVEGAEEIWVGMLGPEVPALGVVHEGPALIQAQVATTVARAAGADWRRFNDSAAAPVEFGNFHP